ncbi:RHS repeat-associated protein [Tahibacter aquaticus]|uniref:RHS repeat-associated protein n=1 Tax=Tahibacter aquaticus TaxID=520092 RepID=A0A4R6Z738_9GAMM|nr:RHS repeat-associated core domain-containing protein [Tahibacter aquaticus]TDR47593.1 RHS repeat-associated protein [Tahibacter aquaticus]
MHPFSHRQRLALLLLAAFLPTQQAASQVSYQEEYAKLIESAQTMAPLKSDLFGDKTSLYNGSTEFIQTDVSLPGNNALPVSFGRRFAVENRGAAGLTSNRYDLGDWDIEVPYLSGVYAEGQGWTVSIGNTLARCSGPANADQAQPPDVASNGDNVLASQFWQAPSMYIPGTGRQPLLFLTNQNMPKPTDGATYRWVTKDNWFLSCITGGNVGNGLGEGFIARSPSGVKYTFNHMVKLTYPPILRERKDANGVQRNTVVNREEVRLYATMVEDRFQNEGGVTLKFPNNYVKYTWDGNQLRTITSGDGRALTLTYSGNRIGSLSDGTRTWTYGYANPTYRSLTSVVLPDGSNWTYDLVDLADGRTKYPISGPVNFVGPQCNKRREMAPAGGINVHTGSMTHPSGATGVFQFEILRHGRYNVDLLCDEGQSTISVDPQYFAGMYPVQFEINSLTKKTITGAGLPAAGQAWQYEYEILPGANRCDQSGNCNIGPQSKAVTLIEPDGSRTVNTYGVRYGENEGQLLGMKVYSPAAALLREQTFAYVTNAEAPSHPFPQAMGEVLNPRSDNMSSVQLRPQKERITVQDGATFRWQALGFDLFARTTDVSRSSTLVGAPRVERTSYHDNYAHWVLGQVAKVEHIADGTPIQTISENVYDVSKAQLLSESSWGKVRKSYSYYVTGMLASVADGAAQTTTFANYFRGVPRYIGYPDSNSEQAEVGNIGNILWVQDEQGYRTTFGYHPTSGRLTSITPPASDVVAWSPTNMLFEKINTAEHGLNTAHWRHTTTTGNLSKVTYFDALLRPVLARERDSARPGQDRVTVRRFDERGREVFAAYPQSAMPSSFTNTLPGTQTVYDALDRTRFVYQNSENGVLETKTEYLAGFKRKVTDPRLKESTTAFWGMDEPSYDLPVEVLAPEGLNMTIQRDIFGLTKRVRRAAVVNGSTLTVSRNYVYDANRRLCKLWENETQANYFGYDAADNVAWTIRGFPSSISSSQCDYAEFGTTPKTTYTYDARNRLRDTVYPAGTSSVFQTYYPDGSLQTTSAGNSTWTYEYNKRRLLEKETLQYDGKTFVLDWAYDSLGSAQSLTYPDGSMVDYAPDAFGRPTQVGSYASGISYYPNNATAQFTYGNGVQHTLTQNARQLPLRSKDSIGSTAILDYEYDYDNNGNVAQIDDFAQGGLESKTLAYDGLNRLIAATSGLWAGTATFEYDALENLRRMQVNNRIHTYTIDTARNRVSQLVSNLGPTLNLSYNNQGNLVGKGSQSFVFDLANRMTSATGPGGSGGESYVYDGHGRRVSILKNGQSTKKYTVYSKEGKLLHELDATGAPTHYIYLAGSLLARLQNGVVTNAPVLSVNPPNKTSGDFTVSWTNVLSNGSYKLSVRRGTSAPQVTTLPWTTLNKLYSSPDGGTYTIGLQACPAVGACSDANPLSYGVTPKKVASVSVPQVQQSGPYSISWQASVDASYRVEQSADNGVNYSLVTASTANTSVQLPGTVAGTYVYKVTAFNSWGDRGGTVSGPVTVVPPNTCDTVTTLATPVITPITLDSPNGYTVRWTEPNCATAYTVEESTNDVNWTAAPGYAAPINLAEAVFTGRANGTYYYRVRASRPGNTPVPFSAYSTSKSIVVSVSVDPPIPANVRLASTGVVTGPIIHLTGNTRRVDVLWDAVANATSYVVKRVTDHTQCAGGDGEQTVTGSPPLAILANQAVPYICGGHSQAPTAYEFQVKACIGSNCSQWSSIARVEVDAPGGGGGNGPNAIEALQPVYYHTDALGSPAAETDAVGTISTIKRLYYEPYGGPLDGIYSDKPGYTGHVADSTTQLNYMQQRYYDPMLGRFLSVDPVEVNKQTGASFNRFAYAGNNPYTFTDPDGREYGAAYATIFKADSGIPLATDDGGKAIGIVVDFIPVVGDVKGIVEAIADPTPINIAGAVIGLFPVGGDIAKAALKHGDEVAALGKAAPDFDTARRTAFENAGMTDASKVEFSKMDEATGTVVEFKGEGGAKVGYDGPHASPGPHHDTQHISWQSAGKRGDGGAKRGNEPYSGERHPSRPDRKDQ